MAPRITFKFLSNANTTSLLLLLDKSEELNRYPADIVNHHNFRAGFATLDVVGEICQIAIVPETYVVPPRCCLQVSVSLTSGPRRRY